MRIIHQIWFDFNTGKSPTDKQVTDDFICRTNPHYQYMYWDLSSALKFVKNNYPKYTAFMEVDTNRNIIKCDFFRYLLMLHFGGYYLDLDFVILKDLDSLPYKSVADIVLTEECYESMESNDTLHNGFLYSRHAGDVFWRTLCDAIALTELSRYSNMSEADVYKLTGTKFLCEQYRSTNASTSTRIKILPFYIVCNHWFVDRVTGEKQVYIRKNEQNTVMRNCTWNFLTIQDILLNQNTLVQNHAVAVCTVLSHGSLWK